MKRKPVSIAPGGKQPVFLGGHFVAYLDEHQLSSFLVDLAMDNKQLVRQMFVGLWGFASAVSAAL